MARRNRSKTPAAAPLVLNGWTFLAWPAFDMRWVALIRAVMAQRTASPARKSGSAEAAVLAALTRVIRDQIAQDPNAPVDQLHDDLKAWQRVKFLGRLRLFYRSSLAHRIVVLTWLDDERTARKGDASTDLSHVFAGMLTRGEVPEDWNALVAGARRMSSPSPPDTR